MSGEMGNYKNEVRDSVTKLISEHRIEEAKKLIYQFEKSALESIVEASSMKAVIMIMEGDLKGAETVIKESLKIDRSNFDLLYNMAYIEECRSENIRALELYNQAIFHTRRKEDLEAARISVGDLKDKAGIVQKCIVCNEVVKSFSPWTGYISEFVQKYELVGSDVVNFGCPHCFAHDRTRHLVLYFDKLDIWNKYISGKSILHIAPEPHIQRIILALPNVKYIGGDLFPSPNSKLIQKVDITQIQFKDESFDFIICNHVLEHIPDDIRAMSELFRVLKKGGRAVLQTPYSPKLPKSFEDNSIIKENDRLEFFGQEDHVRIYGEDLFERLRSVGFHLDLVISKDLFTDEDAYCYGFNNREDLIMVVKD